MLNEVEDASTEQPSATRERENASLDPDGERDKHDGDSCDDSDCGPYDPAR